MIIIEKPFIPVRRLVGITEFVIILGGGLMLQGNILQSSKFIVIVGSMII
jgi:hypothetical protein